MPLDPSLNQLRLLFRGRRIDFDHVIAQAHGDPSPLAPAHPRLKTTAMLPLIRTGTAAVIVIRAPVIVGALREYFEVLWDRATPVTAPAPK